VGSWDKLQIPMPFSRAKVIFGSPIDVPQTADVDGKVAELQISLEDLTERGRVWRETV
jgi:lysophospholipid acyltransferase (LPLAT)-like uncharacterized protein